MNEETLFESMAKSLIDGEIETAQELISKALTDGMDPNECIAKGFKPGLDEIGRGFESGEYFLPDLVLAGKIMQAVVDILASEGQDKFTPQENLGTVMLATVAGDLHSIGKHLVAMMLGLNGFKVMDLGIDVPTATIVERAKEEEPDILGLSALLSTTTGAQKDVIDGLIAEGIRDKVKILVGGAVVSKEWADQIGADGYAEDANAAVVVAKKVMNIA